MQFEIENENENEIGICNLISMKKMWNERIKSAKCDIPNQNILNNR